MLTVSSLAICLPACFNILDDPMTPLANDTQYISPDCLDGLQRSGLQPLHLAGRTLLPIVQGGMGIGISGNRLAGSVAAVGGVGTLSAVDLRRHHPDLMDQTRELPPGEAAKDGINQANLEALGREIKAARERTGGKGLLAVNVMRAVAEYAACVTKALESGIDAVVVGAGLPLDLPDLAKDHPKAALIPILSDARGVQLLVKKSKRAELSHVVDFLMSRSLHQHCSDNFFPSPHPEVAANLPDGKRLFWIGWDFIYGNDLEQVKKEVGAAFTGEYLRTGGAGCS